MAQPIALMETVFTGGYDKKLSGKILGFQPFVLSDMSFVITKKSINRFFGQSGKSDWLNEFMQGFSRYGLGATGLLDQLANPILFEVTKKGGFPTIEESYSVKTLIEACDFIIFAKDAGFLNVIELKFSSLAKTIIDTDHASPIKHQIAELTGLNLLRWKACEKILSALSENQKEKAHVWVKSLSQKFWDFLMRQLDTNWKAIIKNPIPAANFIHQWIFSRIDEKTMENMRQTSPKRSYRSKKGKEHIGNEGLEFYLNILLGLYGVSDGKLSILDQLISRSHPQKRTISLPSEPVKKELPVFAKQLREAMAIKK